MIHAYDIHVLTRNNMYNIYLRPYVSRRKTESTIFYTYIF